MDSLFTNCDTAGLMTRINFDRISGRLKQTELHGCSEIFHPILIDGRPTDGPLGKEPKRTILTKIAHVRKGGGIPPHGHSNMVSAFLHLSGEFHVRQYNKIAEEEDALVVQPTTDVVGGPGLWSSISDVRNNVHWLTAKTDDAFLFTTKIIELEEGQAVRGRVNIDIREAVPGTGGMLRAPKISKPRAAELYG